MKSKQNKFIIVLFVLLLLAAVSLLALYYYKTMEGFANSNRCAIVVLTKGYDSNDKYSQLIDRNNSIYEQLYVKKPDIYDILIFHEGNITNEQQSYIQSATSNMPIKFISIPFQTNHETNSLCPPTDLSKQFSMGYKNMCHFWSIEFFKYVSEYEFIIRIDEDCIIKSIDPNIIQNYKERNIQYSSPFFQGKDEPGVVMGMETFFRDYLQKHGLSPKSETIRSPYTNVFIMNVSYFKNNARLLDLLEELDKSNCIWSNRWGDLPIWGYILSYFFDEHIYIEDKSIQYVHGSHNAKINM